MAKPEWRWISPSQCILKPGERKVLEYLERQHGNTTLHADAACGRPGFSGWVLDSPPVQAATFLSLLAEGAIEPQIGYRTPPDVKAHEDGENADELPNGACSNVVRLRRFRTDLARWFFQLSQALSGNQLKVEPHGFALVLVGEGKVEVLHANLSGAERAQAVDALLRNLAPETTLLKHVRYQISERGRALLQVARLEDRIQACEQWPADLERERDALIMQLPERVGRRRAESGKK